MSWIVRGDLDSETLCRLLKMDVVCQTTVAANSRTTRVALSIYILAFAVPWRTALENLDVPAAVRGQTWILTHDIKDLRIAYIISRAIDASMETFDAICRFDTCSS